MGPLRHNQSGEVVSERRKVFHDLQTRNARRARLTEARTRDRAQRLLEIARDRARRAG